MNQTDKDTEIDQLKRENRELKEKVKYLESAQNEKFLELENVTIGVTKITRVTIGVTKITMSPSYIFRFPTRDARKTQ